MGIQLRDSLCVGAFVLALGWSSAFAQPLTPATAAAEPQTQALQDALGRETPRGTVLGFLAAGRRADPDVARQYLNIRTSGRSADALSHQLYVVLDARLPARVAQVSDLPQGSRSNALKPDEEIIGTIDSPRGDVEIIVERVARADGEPIWLFSQATLGSVPALYAEVTLGWGEGQLPRFLTSTRIGGIRVFEWMAVLLALPLCYLAMVLLNKTLTPLIRALLRAFGRKADRLQGGILPVPVRLFILAVLIRWALSQLSLPLVVRQFWANVSSLFAIAGIVWLLIVVNGLVERYLRRRFPSMNFAAASTLVLVLRRFVDVLVIFAGVLAMLRRLGINAAPALAGLGVGGIAVALAAQKTLENVIAGASLIFDQAVRVGDALRMGTVEGTVEHIGLRSTRIRTLDRTLVSVPNGQIASVSLETLSGRDKFWFHPIVSVRYDTRPNQLHAVVDGLSRLLEAHPSVDRSSVRVRFIKMGTYSLDIEVFAYVRAGDWAQFLEIQEQLLFGVTEVVEGAGTQLAFRIPLTELAEPTRS